MSTNNSEAPSGHARLREAGFWIAWIILLLGAVAIFLFGGHWLRERDAPMWTAIVSTLAYGFAIVAIASMPGLRALRRHLRDSKKAPPALKAALTIIGLMTFYVVVLTGVIFTFLLFSPSRPVSIILAIIPALPVLAAFAVGISGFRRQTDEFIRGRATEAVLWATGFTLALASIWGFLEIFRLVPHIPAVFIVALWGASLGPASVVAWWRYR